MWLDVTSWQLSSLSSNFSFTCKVQDSVFKLIMPLCALSLKLKTQKDNWHVALNFLVLLTLRSSIDQDNDTRMLMHFSIDPVKTVASGVRV